MTGVWPVRGRWAARLWLSLTCWIVMAWPTRPEAERAYERRGG